MRSASGYRSRDPSLGEREEELVLEVLRSGMLSLGPMLRPLRAEFAGRLGVDDAVAVSSGTAGPAPRRPRSGLGTAATRS